MSTRMQMVDGTGIAAVDNLVGWSMAAVAVAALAGLLWRIARILLQGLRRLDDLAEDWTGTPARPGVPARLGLLERVEHIEEQTSRTADHLGVMDRRVAAIEHEMHPNGGLSLRDAVDRVDVRTAQIADEPEGPARP